MSEYPSGGRPADDGRVPLTKHLPEQPAQPGPAPYPPPVQQYAQHQPQYPVQHYAPQQQYGPGMPGTHVVHHVHQGPPVGSKDQTVAFLLWFFLGAFGADRFYLNQVGAGVGILLLWLFGWLTVILVIGWFMLVGVLVWWIVNACLIPGQVTTINARLAHGRF